MTQNHMQFIIMENEREAIIRVYNDKGWAYIHNQFATAADVGTFFGVSRSTAYRIMKQLPRYEVEDYRQPDELHQFSMVKRSDLAAIRRTMAGNPNFSNPAYQKQLAKRPRKKKVDN